MIPFQQKYLKNLLKNDFLPKYNAIFISKKMMLAKVDRGQEKRYSSSESDLAS
jgi:hypothetical protein